MEKFVVMRSHGKVMGKKIQKSWKSENFPLIRVQNIVLDIVVSIIFQLRTSHEKFTRILTAQMVTENQYFYPNLHSKYSHVYYGFQNCPIINFSWKSGRIFTTEMVMENR